MGMSFKDEEILLNKIQQGFEAQICDPKCTKAGAQVQDQRQNHQNGA